MSNRACAAHQDLSSCITRDLFKRMARLSRVCSLREETRDEKGTTFKSTTLKVVGGTARILKIATQRQEAKAKGDRLVAH